MAIGVHIVKGFTWRAQSEETENVYHYDRNPELMSETDFSALIDQIVTIEKSLFGSDVTFLRALIHGPTEGTQQNDRMWFAKDLTGVGGVTGGGLLGKEMAVVAQIYMGRSPAPHFRKTFLRKYWHVSRLNGADPETTRIGNTGLDSTTRDFYKGKMNALKTVVANGVNMNLCKPSGPGVPFGTDAQVLPFLHIRQLRR